MNTRPLWQPTPERAAQTNLAAFMRAVNERHGKSFADYAALYRWSIDSPADFWSALWDYCSVIAPHRGDRVLIDCHRMPGAKWFPDARLNFAENLLQRRDTSDALVFWGEDRIKRRLSHADLYLAVAQLAAALRAQGIRSGDRIAAYLPNMPEAIVCMLATASLGAIFSSASPDFGVQGVVDRFGQIEPKLLIAADGYYYRGKIVDCLGKLRGISARLPSVERTVIVPYVYAQQDLTGIRVAQSYADFVAPHAQTTELTFAYLPFDHPLYILYSSGTTGVPKCIVHGAGGVLLQHQKEHRLHGDIKPGDRLFYFTTGGWMMWNWLASGLASGATLILYDGSPFLDGNSAILFDYADAEGVTHFGTSAKFIDAIAKENLAPIATHKLDKLRAIFSTGSPLAPEGFDYVYRNIKADVCLSSIAGGTDLVSCFVLGNPILPVWRGEIQCRGLGMDVQVYDEHGNSIIEQKGELVCAKPFPTMPIEFWNDPDGSKYRHAYFDKFPNVWCHGDYVALTRHGGMIFYGRSDAVLNPGGVRIGTAEIYRQVEQLPEVVDSLVIGQNWPPGKHGDVRIVLFVRLRPDHTLDDMLIAKIKQAIRDNTTPRHVPAKVLQVADIPRTKSGKIVELAVRNVVHNDPVKNLEALANPEALEYFRDRPELRS
ncbi:MAG: acetoacetate--CoA ligase [Candidatus Muproteobacteria bacterium RBG_16_60_9]|uniref:Acetoacetate--CoA ligase n=1 Tax=Candidatus Muproteobacteria bacterium RBG_16_60_9 TaxID=1817755 RepID=A0A1F6V4G2_9PROT|nr:MAG: acetoacetate--CoA ligase [Candidatus Muproteobacteria bacterium RBG_16_60_9]